MLMLRSGCWRQILKDRNLLRFSLGMEKTDFCFRGVAPFKFLLGTQKDFGRWKESLINSLYAVSDLMRFIEELQRA